MVRQMRPMLTGFRVSDSGPAKPTWAFHSDLFVDTNGSKTRCSSKPDLVGIGSVYCRAAKELRLPESTWLFRLWRIKDQYVVAPFVIGLGAETRRGGRTHTVQRGTNSNELMSWE